MEVNEVGMFVWGAVFGISLLGLGLLAGHSIWGRKPKRKNGNDKNGPKKPS